MIWFPALEQVGNRLPVSMETAECGDPGPLLFH